MGQLRTINHPGIEIFEQDNSGSTEQVGGCTSLVVGFFPQGESATPVKPTSLKSVKSYFGTPENEAERYAYYACKSVFDNGGNLIAARIPYDNNSQYITPACKFNIEEWSTAHVIGYTAKENAGKSYCLEKYSWSNEEYTEKNKYYSSNSPHIEKIEATESYKTYDGLNWSGYSIKDIFQINTKDSTGNQNDYYTLKFNGPFSITKQTSSSENITAFVYENADTKFVTLDYPNIDIAEYNSFTISLESDNDIYNGKYQFAIDYSMYSHDILGSDGIAKYIIIAEHSTNESGGINYEAFTGVVSIYQKNNDPEHDYSRDDPIIVFNNLIFQHGYNCDTGDTELEEGLSLNSKIFCDEGNKYFSIYHCIKDNNNPAYESGTEYLNEYYNEEIIADKTTNFIYSPVRHQPVTGTVQKFTETTETETITTIQSYFKSGEGVVYPEMTSEDFYELRIWNNNKIKKIEDLTEENSKYYDIIHVTYVGEKSSEYSKISDKNFKTAPVTSDVTIGYESEKITSELLAIPAQETWDETAAPAIEAKQNPFGPEGEYINILTKLNNGMQVGYNENDFYVFVSDYYSSIKEVALAKSNKYSWIHYTTNTELTGSGSTGNRVLMAGTLGCDTNDIPEGLSKIENIVSIIPDTDDLGYIPLADYLDYRDEAKKPSENTIVIANITEQKLSKDTYNNTSDETYGEEVLGIVPILVTGFQALPKQSRIELPDSATNTSIFNAIETIVRGSSIENDPAPKADHIDIKKVTLNENGFAKDLATDGNYNPYESTYSNNIISNVPSIDLNTNYKPNGAKTNYVTLVVCKLSLSAVNDNKVALTVLETFTGSLDSGATDEKGNSIFIDTVVNNAESGSAYVKLFSNYKSNLNGFEKRSVKTYEVVYPASVDTKTTIVVPASCGTSNWWSTKKKMFSLGFTEKQTTKYISYATIVATLENVYDMLSNVDEVDIDLVVDAGLTSIANRIKKYIEANPEETKAVYDLTFDKIDSVNDIGGWKSMAAKLITFCQTTRKDCMALIDAPRSLCVKNNAKLIDSKKTTTSKYSVDYDILPKFNYLGGLNSSYGAGFCNWILAVDDFSGKNVWIPPSIAAEGNIIYTDYNSNYWMAPAGEKRGNILWAVDIAFNPSGAQQDSIYSKGWNYAISSGGNIMTWGQKTFLTSNSSFNRINVRRLFLRLERLTRKNSKWVLFELNNQKTRNTYLDRIDPIFANVKAMGGLYDYRIICDEQNNTNTVIDSNEFRACFMLKPSKVAEFLIFTFMNLNTDAVFEEYYGDL